MSTKTANLGLTKPDLDEQYQLAVWNDNSDKIDQYAGEVNAALAEKQAALTFDSVPMTGSSNPVRSGGIRLAIDSEEAARQEADTVITTAVAKIIDTGAKNLLQTASSSGTRFVNVPVVLEPGTYRVYFGEISSTDTDAQTCQCAAFASDNSDASSYLQLQRVNGVNGILTVTKATSYVRLYASNTYANSAGDTITFSDAMLCKEDDWAISQKYVPYCPTMPELYQMILALQSGGTRSAAQPMSGTEAESDA